MNLKREIFIEECQRVFKFLVDDYGFNCPIIEIDSDIHFVIVTYKKVNLALEIIYDEREQDITIKVVHLQNGVKPEYYAVNEKGEVCREDLFIILLEKGVRNFKPKEELYSECIDFTAIDEDSERKFFRKELCHEAILLKTYGHDILNDSPTVFDSLNAKKRGEE